MVWPHCAAFLSTMSWVAVCIKWCLLPPGPLRAKLGYHFGAGGGIATLGLGIPTGLGGGGSGRAGMAGLAAGLAAGLGAAGLAANTASAGSDAKLSLNDGGLISRREGLRLRGLRAAELLRAVELLRAPRTSGGLGLELWRSLLLLLLRLLRLRVEPLTFLDLDFFPIFIWFSIIGFVIASILLEIPPDMEVS